jgi:lantibiotic modifying enzyme
VSDAKADSRLAVANRVARWLDAAAVPTPSGVHWPVDADAARPRFDDGLYHGAAGVVLFYLEHHAATGRRRSLELAREGGRQMWAGMAEALHRRQKGLYTGLAGYAFVFAELYKTTGDAVDRTRAVACVDALAERAIVTGAGCSWNSVTDIISGTAGIGLALLRLDEDLKIENARALAVQAGDGLLAQANRVGPHMRWSMSAGYEREMPNFSHGTAGVAYFLARLHQVTGEARFLGGARAGADYLLSITGDDGLLYHDDQNRELDYLSWCHGPPGTSRLFALLHRATGDPRYREWTDLAVATLSAKNLPTEKTAGFWNNHGQCCGTAGVADFLMHLSAESDSRSRFEARLDHLFAALEAAGNDTEPAGGIRWTGAEHRVRPKFLSTQTGYTQGAAGIGMAFLHSAALLRGSPRRIVLPDSPYPR